MAPAPTGLTVTSDTDDTVSLSWNAVTDAAVYQVEYRRSSSISWLHAGYVYSSTSDTVDGLDCDTGYDFRVRARGDGSPYPTTYGNPSSSVSETTSTCSNNPPAFNPASYSFSVNEDGANGTPVGTVLATDPDVGDAVSYSITPVNAKFAIGKTSGVITVADALDHETQSSHILTVEASDGNGGTDTATVSIAVGDVNEVSISGPGDVDEGADMTFTVTVEQGGVTVTYEISGTATSDLNGDYMDPGVGPLSVTIPAGQTTQSIVINTNSDTTAETFKSVVVTLIGVTVGDAVVDSVNGSATGRIADVISVSPIADDGDAPPIVIDTSESTSTILVKLDTDGVPNDLNPDPPKDTDGRREDSGRGWVRELQGRWPGVLGLMGGRRTVFSRRTGPLSLYAGVAMRGMARGYAAGDSRDRGGARLWGRWVSCRLAVRPGTEWLAAGPRRD